MKIIWLNGWTMIIWLVVEPPVWKIWVRQLGWLFPIYGKIKNVPNHQPVMLFNWAANLAQHSTLRPSPQQTKVLTRGQHSANQVWNKLIWGLWNDLLGCKVKLQLWKVGPFMTSDLILQTSDHLASSRPEAIQGSPVAGDVFGCVMETGETHIVISRFARLRLARSMPWQIRCFSQASNDQSRMKYPLVNKHSYGKSPLRMGKLTINGHVQKLC